MGHSLSHYENDGILVKQLRTGYVGKIYCQDCPDDLSWYPVDASSDWLVGDQFVFVTYYLNLKDIRKWINHNDACFIDNVEDGLYLSGSTDNPSDNTQATDYILVSSTAESTIISLMMIDAGTHTLNLCYGFHA